MPTELEIFRNLRDGLRESLRMAEEIVADLESREGENTKPVPPSLRWGPMSRMTMPYANAISICRTAQSARNEGVRWAAFATSVQYSRAVAGEADSYTVTRNGKEVGKHMCEPGTSMDMALSMACEHAERLDGAEVP